MLHATSLQLCFHRNLQDVVVVTKSGVWALKNPWHGPNGPRPKQVPWWAPSCNPPASSASHSRRFKAHCNNLPYSDNSKPLNYSNNLLSHLMPKKCLSPKTRNFKSNPKATKSNPKPTHMLKTSKRR